MARPRVAGAAASDLALAARLAGAALAGAVLAVALAGFTAVALAAVLDVALVALVAFVAFAVDLAARFAGADPLADLAAGAFLAGVLVAVRFTG